MFAELGRSEDLDKAISLITDYDTGQLSVSMMHPFAFFWAARACLVASRCTEAKRFAEMAIEQEEMEVPDVGVRAWGEWARIECARLENMQDDVHIGKLDEIIQFAESRGMRPLRAHCMATGASLTGSAKMAKEAHSLAGKLKMSRLIAEIEAIEV